MKSRADAVSYFCLYRHDVQPQNARFGGHGSLSFQRYGSAHGDGAVCASSAHGDGVVSSAHGDGRVSSTTRAPSSQALTLGSPLGAG
jgi:hypothetical protein